MESIQTVNDITLPIELYKLDLSEIGAIFVLMATPYMDDSFKSYWDTNDNFRIILNRLIDEEIILNTNEGVEVDLTWV
jgi:hypothetical protein